MCCTILYNYWFDNVFLNISCSNSFWFNTVNEELGENDVTSLWCSLLYSTGRRNDLFILGSSIFLNFISFSMICFWFEVLQNLMLVSSSPVKIRKPTDIKFYSSSCCQSLIYDNFSKSFENSLANQYSFILSSLSNGALLAKLHLYQIVFLPNRLT